MGVDTLDPDTFLPILRAVAAKGGCTKDTRAATLIKDGALVTCAANGPPTGYVCTRDAACARTCGQTAVHAEMRALMAAHRQTREGAEMIHARFLDGELVPSRSPRCAACTKHMLDAGVAGLWLFRDRGWQRYAMVAAHELGARARELHVVHRDFAWTHRLDVEGE